MQAKVAKTGPNQSHIHTLALRESSRRGPPPADAQGEQNVPQPTSTNHGKSRYEDEAIFCCKVYQEGLASMQAFAIYQQVRPPLKAISIQYRQI